MSEIGSKIVYNDGHHTDQEVLEIRVFDPVNFSPMVPKKWIERDKENGLVQIRIKMKLGGVSCDDLWFNVHKSSIRMLM